MDLSQLSDQELMDLKKTAPPPGPSMDLSHLSDDDLLKLKAQSKSKDSPGFMSDLGHGLLGDKQASERIGQRAIDATGAVGKFVDRFAGSPVRAGIDAAQSGENPLPAYLNQFGEDPDKAPTGQQIVLRAGVPEKLSGAAGIAMDFAADPTVLGSGLAKGAKAIGLIGKSAEGAADTAKVAEESGLLSRFANEPKPNADEISAAAGNLKTQATPGMLSNNKSIQTLENTLEKSPTVAGGMAQKNKTKVFDAMKGALGDTAKDRANLSAYDVGDEVKNSIVQKVQEQLMPLKMSYEEMRGLTENMPLNPRSQTKIARGLRLNPMAEFPDTQTGKILNQYADNIEKAKSVSSLRTLEINAQAGLRSSAAAQDSASVRAYGKVIDTLKRAQDSHILRSSVESAPNATQAKNVGKGIVDQLKATNKGYRSLMEMIEQINPGIRSKNPQGFLDALDDIPNEKIQQKFFTPSNFDKLQNIKQHLPEQFETMRKSYLDGIVSAASDNGQINPSKFLRQIKNMTPQAKTLIFGTDSQKVFGDVETLLNSIPKNENPSGTAHSLQWANLFRPSHWPQEAADAFKYAILQGGPTSPQNLKTVGSSSAKAAKGLLRASPANPDLYNNNGQNKGK